MNFPYEVPLVAAHSIVSWNREIERCPKVAGMRQCPFLNPLLQPAQSRSIAQSAKLLHFLGRDIVVLLEILHQQTVNFYLADFFRTFRILGTQKLGVTQLFQQLGVGLIHHPFELDTLGADFMPVTDGRRLGTDAERTDAIYLYTLSLRQGFPQCFFQRDEHARHDPFLESTSLGNGLVTG